MKMKKCFIISLMNLFLNVPITINASASVYHPLLNEGKVWNMYYSNYSRSYELTICVRIIGDTIVDNEQCYKATSETIDRATGNAISKGGSVAVFLEKDRKVFERRNDNWRLLYDFNLQQGDVSVVNDVTQQEVVAVDDVEVNENSFRRMTLKETYVYKGDSVSVTGYWVEGVGSSFGLLLPNNWTAMDGSMYLESCYEDGECIFYAADFYKSGDTTDIKATNHVQRTKNNVLFDLQGRPVQGSPNHGVYIQNGKKVMR